MQAVVIRLLTAMAIMVMPETAIMPDGSRSIKSHSENVSENDGQLRRPGGSFVGQKRAGRYDV